MNKPKIGDCVEYWYNRKFKNGEIIDKTKNYVIVKLWISILTPTILNIQYPQEWKNNIKNNYIVKVKKNKTFPLWVKICQLCVVHKCNDAVTGNHNYQQIVAKIAKYQDGKNITLFYISYPTHSYKTKKLKMININIHKIKKLSSDSTYINFIDTQGKNNILYPYLDQIEIDSHYDKINDINDDQLIMCLWRDKRNINNTSLKSTGQQIIKHNHDDNDNNNCNEHNEYITTSRLQYGVILECESFPFDINRLIISFLAQRMIYICPPTPCNKLKDIHVAQMWQFVEKNEERDKYGFYNANDDHWQLAVIGCEFKMNRDLWINGFELNNIELLGKHEHKIYLDRERYGSLELNQLQLKQELRNAQFVFNENKLFQLKRGKIYSMRIKLNANVPCYQCHLPPAKVNKFNQYPNNQIRNWKCFEYIRWKKFHSHKEFRASSIRLEWFPHLAFLLP